MICMCARYIPSSAYAPSTHVASFPAFALFLSTENTSAPAGGFFEEAEKERRDRRRVEKLERRKHAAPEKGSVEAGQERQARDRQEKLRHQAVAEDLGREESARQAHEPHQRDLRAE